MSLGRLYVFCILIIFAGCGALNPAEVKMLRVGGIVVDDVTDEPIPNLEVYLYEAVPTKLFWFIHTSSYHKTDTVVTTDGGLYEFKVREGAKVRIETGYPMLGPKSSMLVLGQILENSLSNISRHRNSTVLSN